MTSQQKWAEISSRRRPSWYLDPLVAEQKRRAHLDLLDLYAEGLVPDVVLKTDLFEEAYGEDGLFTDLFPRARLRLGMDLAPATVERARRSAAGSANYLCTDVRRLPLRSGSVDLILSNSTLDHFGSAAELTEALAELVRVLKPEGRFIITLDNPRNLLYWPLRFFSRLGSAPFPLGHTLSRSALTAALERCGLRVEKTGTLIHNPRGLSTLLFLALRTAMGRRADPAIRWLLRSLSHLEQMPTREFTCCFVSACGVKPAAQARARSASSAE